MIYLLIFVVWVAIIVIMLGCLGANRCSGECAQGRRCTCCQESDDA